MAWLFPSERKMQKWMNFVTAIVSIIQWSRVRQAYLRYVKPSQPGILAIELRNMKAPENIGARRTRIRSVFVGTVGRYADANPKQI